MITLRLKKRITTISIYTSTSLLRHPFARFTESDTLSHQLCARQWLCYCHSPFWLLQWFSSTQARQKKSWNHRRKERFILNGNKIRCAQSRFAIVQGWKKSQGAPHSCGDIKQSLEPCFSALSCQVVVRSKKTTSNQIKTASLPWIVVEWRKEISKCP